MAESRLGEPSVAQLANPTYSDPPPYTGAWKGCAYDPELPGPIYHTDQVRVPPTLVEVVRLYSKAVLTRQPDASVEDPMVDLITWSKEWFETRAAELASAPAEA